MIDELTVGNFRAFKSQHFRFSRLNIFVGPNNSGKSSAISALNLLAQSFSQPLVASSPIILNGVFDQLGTFKDMVHGGRANTPVKLSLKIGSFLAFYEFKYRTQRREVELSRFRLLRDGSAEFEYQTSNERYDVLLRGRKAEEVVPGWKKYRPGFSGLVPVFNPSYEYRRTLNDRHRTELDKTLSALIETERSLNLFRRELFSIYANYDALGPFRVVPQRTYLYSGEVADKVGRNGENTVALLASDNSKRGGERLGLVEEISRWMLVTGISGGVAVKNLTDRHFEIAVSGQDGVEHNICDVGFGCSQVLPVLVAGLRYASGRGGGGSTLVIQEPEIHLHPNAQAALGSFFVNIARKRGQIFIETHSDNLILRVARHIASGDIPSGDVKVFYVRDEAGEKSVSEIGFDSSGGFVPQWPGGFFPQRQSESFGLARAAISKSHPSGDTQLEFVYPEERK